MARSIESAQECDDDALERLAHADAYEVAPEQELLLELELRHHQPTAFYRNDVYEIDSGDVDVKRLRAAFRRLLERHESLRTGYAHRGGKFYQIVHSVEAMELPFALHNVSDHDDPRAAAASFYRTRIRERFDIGAQSLIRTDLVHVTASLWLLVVSMHPLISDGRTVDVLMHEWLQNYEGRSLGSELTSGLRRVQYRDAAAHRHKRLEGKRLANLASFWSRELEGATTRIPLRTLQRKSGALDLAGDRVTYRGGSDLLANLERLSAGTGVTLYVLAVSAVQILLAQEAGARDVVLGTYTRGRNRSDLEDQIGCYIRTVPLRLLVSPDDEIATLLRRTQRTVLRTLRHDSYPFQWSATRMGWYREPERHPLFDVMVAMDELEELNELQATSSLRLHAVELPRMAKEAEVQFTFAKGADALELSITYNTSLFERHRVEAWLSALRGILEGMVLHRYVEPLLSTTQEMRSKRD